MKKIRNFVISLFLLLPLVIGAYDGGKYVVENPASVTKALTDIITEIAELMSSDSGMNESVIKEQIVGKAINFFDFNRMTALAVGFPWKHATAEQKIKLSREFKYKLISTYYNALMRVKDIKVEIKQNPLIKNAGREIVIQSKVASVSVDIKNPIEMDYSLYKTGQGYKIYNINVQGISLVTVYRGKFSEIIQEKGIDGLIETLKVENNNKVSKRNGL